MELPPQTIILISVPIWRSNIINLLTETLNSLQASVFRFRVVVYLPASHHNTFKYLGTNSDHVFELVDMSTYRSAIENYRSFTQHSKCRDHDWIIFMEPGDLLLPYGLVPLRDLGLANGYLGRSVITDSATVVESSSVLSYISRNYPRLRIENRLSGSGIRFEWLRTFAKTNEYDLVRYLSGQVPSVVKWTDYALTLTGQGTYSYASGSTLGSTLGSTSSLGAQYPSTDDLGSLWDDPSPEAVPA